jgi:hypothetical protein
VVGEKDHHVGTFFIIETAMQCAQQCPNLEAFFLPRLAGDKDPSALKGNNKMYVKLAYRLQFAKEQEWSHFTSTAYAPPAYAHPAVVD